MDAATLFFGITLVAFAAVFLLSTVRIVPQQNAYVVERLGRYHTTLNAGLHIILPFIDSVRYKHSLKECVLDIPEQVCITKDNVQVNVDGILFFRVIDPLKASYGVADYELGLIQLAQTTLRSEVGKIDLDRCFEARERMNEAIVMAIDKASDPWGVKVLRYEIKSINPPRDVIAAMEKQMRAEREKRAQILESEGDRDAKINRAEGAKQERIKQSEADKQAAINEAEGEAAAILSVAQATAEGLSAIARALSGAGGLEAAKLRVAEEYLKQFGELARQSTTLIVPATTSDVASIIAQATSVFRHLDNGGTTPTSPSPRSRSAGNDRPPHETP
jgi:regulator of protease activity HflC (stomatin/prohibitin superfamily)